MSEHTPGPWRYVDPDPEEVIQEMAIVGPKHVDLDHSEYIATIHDVGSALANARLIAAAPALLAACEAAAAKLLTVMNSLGMDDSGNIYDVVWNQLRAAIAAAKDASP